MKSNSTSTLNQTTLLQIQATTRRKTDFSNLTLPSPKQRKMPRKNAFPMLKINTTEKVSLST
jgi:hypothetical protein